MSRCGHPRFGRPVDRAWPAPGSFHSAARDDETSGLLLVEIGIGGGAGTVAVLDGLGGGVGMGAPPALALHPPRPGGRSTAGSRGGSGTILIGRPPAAAAAGGAKRCFPACFGAVSGITPKTLAP